MADLERLEVPEQELGPCANPACVDGAQTPRVRLYEHVFPTLCGRCVAESDAAEAERERRERLERLMGRSGVTARMRAWSLASSPANPAALERAREWLTQYRAGTRFDLVLFGPAGRGKTGLAWGIVRELIESDLVDARLVNWRDLLHRMQESFGEFGPSLSTDELRQTSVLALDDLGAEAPTDWRRGELATLIEHRYQALLPTIYTSNYSLGELKDRLGRDDPVIGARLVSRIADDALLVSVEGHDRRIGVPPAAGSSGPARQA